MKSYITGILTIAFIGGVVSSLVSNKKQNTKKYINFLIGLISAIILMTPIIKTVKDTAIMKNKITNFIETLTDTDKITNINIS